ncbi:tudor domain-containing protein 1 isoform X2 [Stigmatopora nigra]
MKPFSYNMVWPSLPLRRPMHDSPSPPGRITAASSPFKPDLLSAATVSPQPNSPTVTRPMTSPLFLCQTCDREGGNLRCTRCKNTRYCSTLCQREDWKIHRLICRPADPENAKKKLNPTVSLSTLANNVNGLDVKQPTAQDVYFKDLRKMKINEGTEIQSSDPHANMAELLVSADYAAPIHVKPDPIPHSPDDHGFPLDWKTVELPIDNLPFKPYIAAVASPSLFFVLRSNPEVEEKLPCIMLELATLCTGNQAALSSLVDRAQLLPGAACCAQFIADGRWYRAVVLEAGEDDTVAVLYADYGNTEKLPMSRILPIPAHLLELPFQIARCALIGKELTPAKWPQEARQIFLKFLQDDSLATTVLFDGSNNILDFSRPPERGNGPQLNTLILDTLVEDASSSSAADGEKSGPPDIPLTSDLETAMESTKTIPQSALQIEEKPQKSAACCCSILLAKIERLEEKMDAFASMF